MASENKILFFLRSRVIVSAPKANASQPDGLNQPGQVYKCHIDYRNCTEIIFEFGGKNLSSFS